MAPGTMGWRPVMRSLLLLFITQASFCSSLSEKLLLSHEFDDPVSPASNQSSMMNNSNETYAKGIMDVIRRFDPESLIEIYKEKTSLQKVAASDEVNNSCTAQLSSYVNGLSKFETWTLKMLDSSSKMSSGILMGNNKELGQYDECVSITEFKQGIGSMRGHYCMYSLSFATTNLPMTVSQELSICIPSACGPEDLNEILEVVISRIADEVPFTVGVGSVQCSPLEAKPYETGAIITITVFLGFLCFLTGCTLYDVFVRAFATTKTHSTKNGFCNFSLYTNLLRIFNTPSPKGTIASIQGIRFFSLCWIILAHEYITTLWGAVVNMADVHEWMNSWSSVYILIAPYAVDTFFTLSGFLTSYLFMKDMSKGYSFNLIFHYLHRYIRLTPALAALILMTIYILPRWGSGALWQSIMVYQSEQCKENWWPILLYIHNYANTDHLLCLTHTWYLAVDMQFFWISPLILYPLAKKPKIGLVLLITLIVASIIWPAIIVVQRKYPASMIYAMANMKTSGDMMKNFYMASHARAGPWLLGVLLGYILSKQQNPRVGLIKLGWLATILAFAFIFFTYRIFQGQDYKGNELWEVFYAAVSKHIWAFTVCWLIYSTTLGYGGIIGRILSWPIYLPFTRISYSVYLVHFMTQIMRSSAGRAPIYFSDGGVIYSFFAELILSCLAGLLWYLVFESPFIALEKMIFNKPKQRESQPDNKSHLRIVTGDYVQENSDEKVNVKKEYLYS